MVCGAEAAEYTGDYTRSAADLQVAISTQLWRPSLCPESELEPELGLLPAADMIPMKKAPLRRSRPLLRITML